MNGELKELFEEQEKRWAPIFKVIDEKLDDMKDDIKDHVKTSIPWRDRVSKNEADVKWLTWGFRSIGISLAGIYFYVIRKIQGL